MIKIKFWFLAAILGSVFLSGELKAQTEVNLLTNCATNDIRIPVQIQNFQNISSFELILTYNPAVVSFSQSLIHNSAFTLNNDAQYKITVTDNGGTLRMVWSAYYGVNITKDILLFLEFNAVSNGNANFTWDVAQSHIYQIGDIEQTVNYQVQNSFSLPYTSPYQINVNQLVTGCRDDSENGCKAQAEVVLTGGTQPYSYHWYDTYNQRTATAIGLCQEPVNVIVTDASGCSFGDIFQAKIHPANTMEINANPELAYITKPTVNFESTYLDTEPQSYKWDFGDGGTAFTANAEHTFQDVATYSVSLWTRSDDGCDTTVYIPNYQVRELDFCIPNVFTPNGDQINDTWVFKIGDATSTDATEKTGYYETKNCAGEDLIFRDHFKHTRLVVINRNGSKVYECSDCEEGWDGGNLPDGVYFYVFEWEGEYSSGREQGDVTILRGN